ncbi:MAG: pantoate--beta-alanine ligase [Verrucomicrobiota bacterium]|jgi:pantoate--beta-alanine ligase|nr:pantoate--beta-alanine ligase [Verrucomicrobiota bacterium]
MKIITAPSDMQQTALLLREKGRRLALVPTMGNLHEGHLSLIRLGRQHADVVVVSDFVNPLQFGPNEDYDAYPRTFSEDVRLAQQEKVDILFHPSVEQMYPEDSSLLVSESALSHALCGASRPGHFDGVCTVVAKLFHMVLPHVAVFGEKDAQQLRIIRRMVRNLWFPIEIIGASTSREADGLARSSRNQYLSASERSQARALHQALEEARTLFLAGERSPSLLIASMRAVLERAAPDAQADYIAIVDDETLRPVTEAIAGRVLLALAVRLGKTRLIDNIVLRP